MQAIAKGSVEANDTKLQSEVIQWLRFPLIAAVVYVHCWYVYADRSYDMSFSSPYVWDNVFWVITATVCHFAVPLFFFISGYLFFHNTRFDKRAYLSKLERRYRSLFIPYIFWNTVCIMAVFCMQYLHLHTPENGVYIWQKSLLALYSWQDIDHLWQPFSGQLWFIRDLMIVVLVSPLVYLWVKYLRVWGIVLLGAAFIFITYQVWYPPVAIKAFFFFAFGAYFSIHKRNFLRAFSSSYALLATFVICSTVYYIFWTQECEYWTSASSNLVATIGVMTAISLAMQGIRRGILHPTPLLAASSFFIYAYHYILMPIYAKAYLSLVRTDNEVVLFLGTLAVGIVAIGIGLLVYYLLSRYMPRLTAFICGGR